MDNPRPEKVAVVERELADRRRRVQRYVAALHQQRPLGRVIFFGDLAQGMIKIQLLQGVQHTVALGHQSREGLLFLADQGPDRTRRTAGDVR